MYAKHRLSDRQENRNKIRVGKHFVLGQGEKAATFKAEIYREGRSRNG